MHGNKKMAKPLRQLSSVGPAKIRFRLALHSRVSHSAHSRANRRHSLNATASERNRLHAPYVDLCVCVRGSFLLLQSLCAVRQLHFDHNSDFITCEFRVSPRFPYIARDVSKMIMWRSNERNNFNYDMCPCPATFFARCCWSFGAVPVLGVFIMFHAILKCIPRASHTNDYTV